MSTLRASRSSPTLSIAKKTQLIECVRIRPCLWDHHCEAFKSSNTRQAAFNEIVTEISDSLNQFTRTQIQEEWGKIRYCFTRIMKKFLTAEDESDAVSWPHWNEMQFMYDTIKEHLLATGLASAFGHSSKRYRKYSTAFSLIQKSNMIDGMSKNTPFISDNVFSSLKSRNLRKRRYNRLFQHKNNNNNQIDSYSCSSSPSENINTDASLSSAAAKVLLNLGIDPNISNENRHNNIKAEQTSDSTIDNNDMENGLDDRFLSISTPGSDKYTHNDSTAENNWKSFLTSNNVNTTNALNALAFPLNDADLLTGSKSLLPQFPSTSVSSVTAVANAVTNALNVNNGSDLRSGLPSIESNDAILNDSKTNDFDSNRDTNEFFGKYIVQQMQAVSTKNSTLGVLLRKELMEVCCKYELQAFS